MKKIVLAAICIIGFQSSSIGQEIVEMTSSSTAQDSARTYEPKINFYAAFGAAFVGDYNISDKLKMAGAPQMADVLPEFTVGYNLDFRKWMLDFEVNANYSDDKNSTTRVRTGAFGVKLRGHYVPFRTQSFFISAGADASFVGTQTDIFTRGNVIDLNDLDPATHNGHISLNNKLVYAGPSVAIGFFQNKSFPLRLNLGYEWGLTNGKWESDFADVSNTVKESGHGRAYAKLTLGL